MGTPPAARAVLAAVPLTGSAVVLGPLAVVTIMVRVAAPRPPPP